jgi:hypothetical protein
MPAAMPIRDALVTLYEMLGDKAAADVHRAAIRDAAAARPTSSPPRGRGLGRALSSVLS